MRKTRLRWALLVIGLAVCGAAAFAQGTAQTTDWGKREFEANCASCHGEEGKGDGPKSFGLSAPSPDLTKLSARNGGTFPR